MKQTVQFDEGVPECRPECRIGTPERAFDTVASQARRIYGEGLR